MQCADLLTRRCHLACATIQAPSSTGASAQHRIVWDLNRNQLLQESGEAKLELARGAGRCAVRALRDRVPNVMQVWLLALQVWRSMGFSLIV